MACTSAYDADFAKATSAGSQESFGKIVDEPPDDLDDQEKGADDADIDAKLMQMRKSLAMARGSANTKATIGKLMKSLVGRSVGRRRAASATKRPAAWITKLPDQPKLRTRFAALQYKNVRIDWGGERGDRVRTPPKKATKNFTWCTESDAPRVWSELLAFCEANAAS